MIRKIFQTKNLIWLILLYGLLLTVFNLDYMAPFVDEAYHIVMGRQLLRGEACPGCPFSSGWVYIHPVTAAAADSIGGIYAVRGMNIILGLLLVFCVFVTARRLFNEKIGVIAAAILMFSGQTAYLMRLGTYDMMAAFLLGCSFMIIALSTTEEAGGRRRALILIGGMLLLFFAAVSKYLLPSFVPAIVLWALYKHRFSRAMIFSVSMLAVMAACFWFLAPFSPKQAVMGQIMDFKSDTHVPFFTLADRTLRWLALAYLLSVFGMFHEKYGRPALHFFLLSLPIVLVHLLTQAEQSVNKNVFFAIIFLAPSAAIGIDRIGSLFAMRSPGKVMRRFFSVAVIVVFWAYGMHNYLWLSNQYPDVRPIVEFFEKEGFDGMTVAMNGWDSDIYIYSLNSRFPHANYIHITDAVEKDENGDWVNEKADFVLCEDNYYGRFYPCSDYGEYIDEDYQLLDHFMFELSWGITDSRIYGRSR